MISNKYLYNHEQKEGLILMKIQKWRKLITRFSNTERERRYCKLNYQVKGKKQVRLKFERGRENEVAWDWYMYFIYNHFSLH